jgi:hypothetical protein
MSNFIEQLNNDINKQNKINSNPNLYIKSRKMKLYNFNKDANKLSEIDLPQQAYLGCLLLIKNSNIIEFYCYYDSSHSLYLQVSKNQPLWIGNVTAINIEPSDPEHIKYLLDGNDVCCTPSNYHYFILQFLQSGFKLYN